MGEKANSELRLEVERRDRAVVIRVVGSVDMTDTDEFAGKLAELTAAQTPVIVLDLSDMEFICSQGLGCIITAHLKGRHYQGLVLLVNPQPAVYELFQTTRLTHLFPVFESVDAALTS